MKYKEFDTIQDFLQYLIKCKGFICPKCNRLIHNPSKCDLCGCDLKDVMNDKDNIDTYLIKGHNIIFKIFKVKEG